MDRGGKQNGEGRIQEYIDEEDNKREYITT